MAKQNNERDLQRVVSREARATRKIDRIVRTENRKGDFHVSVKRGK